MDNFSKENSKLKKILALRDSEIKQIEQKLSKNKITEQNMLMSKDDEYSNLEKEYNKILSEYSSLKTERDFLFKQNSKFLKEEDFFLTEMDRLKKKISQSDLFISRLETNLKEKDESYNYCKLILEKERERHIQSSKTLNSDFNSLSTFYENHLNEKKIEYFESEKSFTNEIEVLKKKLSEYVSLISKLKTGLDQEEKSHQICRDIIGVFQEEIKSLENINSDHNSTTRYLPYIVLFFLVFCISQTFLFPVV